MTEKVDVTLIQIMKIQSEGTGKFTIPPDMPNDLIDGIKILEHEVKLIAEKKSFLSANQRKLTLKLNTYIEKTS